MSDISESKTEFTVNPTTLDHTIKNIVELRLI